MYEIKDNKLSRPQIVGFMSVDGHRQYHSDLSQLKYLNLIPLHKVSYNLNLGIHTAEKRTTDENNEKLTLLLQFLVHQKHKNRSLQRIKSCADFTFICYRRTLISVMCSAFGSKDPWRIMATIFNGSIFLCSLDTDHQIQKRKHQTPFEEKCCAWGYKFEQYLLSDRPHLSPDVSKSVIENEEFSIYYEAHLNNHKLFYGAQIDGLLATSGTVENPPTTNYSEAILDYLRCHRFIELKTNKEILNKRQEQNFKRYKLLRCWCQCYLADLAGLLVGFRDDNGIVQRVQWYNTEDIEHYCKNEWDPQTALAYLSSFLDFVKASFKNHMLEKYGKPLNACSEPVSLQFLLHTDNKITVTSNFDEEKDAIIPHWFLEKWCY